LAGRKFPGFTVTGNPPQFAQLGAARDQSRKAWRLAR
jgi:hypothetical protein